MAGNRRKRLNALGILLIAVCVLIICFVVYRKSSELKNEQAVKQAELDRLNAELEKETERGKDLRAEADYRKTDDYIRQEAKDVLGLADPDEKIFVPIEGENGN